MSQLSGIGKLFFWVAVVLGVTAVIHISRGNHGVGVFIGVLSVFEFFLAYHNRKQFTG